DGLGGGEGAVRPRDPDLGHVHQRARPARRAPARDLASRDGQVPGGAGGLGQRGGEGALTDLPIEQTCFWMAGRPAREAEPLRGEADADFAIVGGGYTGLWTALFLKELEPSASIAVLEQELVGHGGSGRNAGIAGEPLDHSHELAIAHFGVDEARTMARVGRENLAGMEAWLAARGVDAG